MTRSLDRQEQDLWQWNSLTGLFVGSSREKLHTFHPLFLDHPEQKSYSNQMTSCCNLQINLSNLCDLPKSRLSYQFQRICRCKSVPGNLPGCSIHREEIWRLHSEISACEKTKCLTGFTMTSFGKCVICCKKWIEQYLPTETAICICYTYIKIKG